MPQAIAIIGAGVVGLSSAIVLARAGYGVKVFAESFTPGTTSDRAAAYFAPLGALSHPQLRTTALDSLAKVAELARDPSFGVRAAPLYELSQHPYTPAHMTGLPGFKDLSGVFAPPWNYGFAFDSFQFDVPTYMPRLMREAKRLGAELQQRPIKTLTELRDGFKCIVNCSGLGAHDLGDASVYPIRGQVIRVSKPDPFPDIVISAETADQITYVVPRLTDIILGGVYQHHNDDLRIDEATADAIWLRCLALRPELEGSKILEHRTGLRPGRSSPRLEAERLGSTTIIHNYGHGSIGHTLAWGCAEWVLAQVQSKVA